jgi:hypothetical protein
MHISLPEFDDTTVFEFWSEIMAPPHPLALFHLQPPRPTFFGVDPTPPLYNTNSVTYLWHRLTGRVPGLNHPTPPLARSSGFSHWACAIFVLQCRTYHKYWTMDLVRLFWHIIIFCLPWHRHSAQVQGISIFISDTWQRTRKSKQSDLPKITSELAQEGQWTNDVRIESDT